MSIYQDNGYVDIRKIKGYGLPFNFVVGGRATGKTYTSLLTEVEDAETFILMRRTQSQADLINKPEFSPFKKICADKHWNICSEPVTKYNAAFYFAEIEPDGNGKNIAHGLPLGYTCALSTISNIRGFDASDVRTLIFDEFIPEKHERPIKNEGAAFLNAYETINRNRELNGEKPLQVLALANANNMANPIFLELGLVKIADKMRQRGQEVSIDRERGVGLFLLNNSPISEQKRETALYRLARNNEFARMSLSNDFAFDEIGNIKSQNLKEYKLICTVGEISLYKHKSNNVYYVSTHRTGTGPVYGSGVIDLARFSRNYSWFWLEYMRNNVIFEEYLCEILLTKYYGS